MLRKTEVDNIQSTIQLEARAQKMQPLFAAVMIHAKWRIVSQFILEE